MLLKEFCCCSVTKSRPTLCNPMNCSTPGFPVLHRLQELAQTHMHWVSDAIQPSHPRPPPSPFALNLSQSQSVFQWVGSSHQVAKVLELRMIDTKNDCGSLQKQFSNQLETSNQKMLTHLNCGHLIHEDFIGIHRQSFFSIAIVFSS